MRTTPTNKAYAIDPKRRVVEELYVGGLHGQSVVDVVGGGPLDCVYPYDCPETQACHTFPKGTVIYVDDEGLLRDSPEFWILLNGFGHITHLIAGNGVMVGPTDEDGNDTSVTTPIENVRAAVRFIPADKYHLAAAAADQLLDLSGTVLFSVEESMAHARKVRGVYERLRIALGKEVLG